MTAREQWDALVRYVNNLDAKVQRGPGQLTLTDAWALLEMYIAEEEARELEED